MGHAGNYSREEAIAAIDKERTLPDVLSFDPLEACEVSQRPRLPNAAMRLDGTPRSIPRESGNFFSKGKLRYLRIPKNICAYPKMHRRIA
jgi:hypothetical protein